jgi:HEAT repeat protein
MSAVLPTLLLSLFTIGPSRGCEQRLVAELVAALGDADGDVRALAAEMLGEIEPTDACSWPPLIAALRDETESHGVRVAAAGSLRRAARRDALALEALVQTATDGGADWRVRAQCLQSLWSLDAGHTLAAVVEGWGPVQVVTPRGTIALEPGTGDVPPEAELALEDVDPRVRRLAVIALSLRGLGKHGCRIVRPDWVRGTITTSEGVVEQSVVTTTSALSRVVHVE